MSRGGQNKLTHADFSAKVFEKYGEKIQLQSKYMGAMQPITCYCNECQKEFSKTTAIQLCTSVHGCPTCGKRISSERMKKTKSWTPKQYKALIKKVNPRLQLLEDYSPEMTHIKTKCLDCGTESERSTQTIKASCGCPVCYAKSRIIDPEVFAKDIRKQFKGKVKLLTEYKGGDYPVTCQCKDCGTQWEAWPTELKRQKIGCPTCNREYKQVPEADYRKRLKVISNNTVELVGDYEGVSTPTLHRCKTCNYEWITNPGLFRFSEAKRHKSGVCLCPQCSKKGKEALSLEEVLDRFRETHIIPYDYSKVHETYKNYESEISIRCYKHGWFKTFVKHHINGGGDCPTCSVRTSRPQRLLAEELQKLGLEVMSNKRFGGNEIEVDIYLPEYGIAVEVNGVYYHSTKFRSNINFHADKYDKCLELGIKLYQFWDFEINEKLPIVLSMLRVATVGAKTVKGAREFVVDKVPHKEAQAFFQQHHLQGPGPTDSFYYGLYTKRNRRLAAVMSFARSRKPQIAEWELSRFATHKDLQIRYGATRLLTAFLRENSPKSILSYANRMYSQGGLYTQLKFKAKKISRPQRFFALNNFIITSVSEKYRTCPKWLVGYDPELSKAQNLTEAGFLSVYDAGKILFVWKPKKSKESKK